MSAQDGQPVLAGRLADAERAELARLRKEVAYYKDRDFGERYWHPGMKLKPGTEHLLPAYEEGWQRDLARQRHELALRREAGRELDAAEQAQAYGSRRIMTYDSLVALPKPVWVYGDLLTQGFHGLAGPPEAGKSLLVRNWLCEIAASGRNVLYVLSEGQFDLADRFSQHPLTSQARPHLGFLDAPLNLASPSDVAWLCDSVRGQQPGLVVFDMIYGFGLPDDNGVQGVAPVISGCKQIAAGLGAAVLAVGHPGHNGERRFRGSSMWRGSFDSEWHMADGLFSCEKHKYADKRKLHWQYTVDWPQLRLLGEGEVLGRAAERLAAVSADFREFPEDTDVARARRLRTRLGVGEDRARKLIADYRRSRGSDLFPTGLLGIWACPPLGWWNNHQPVPSAQPGSDLRFTQNTQGMPRFAPNPVPRPR